MWRSKRSGLDPKTGIPAPATRTQCSGERTMFMNRWIAALAFLTLVAALGSALPAQADTLGIMVTEDGGAPIEILDNGPLDSDNNEGAITVFTDALNPVLMNF